jgi:hypothetical protein
LIEFLENNWSLALFHESFPELRLVVSQGLCDILRQDEEKEELEKDDDTDDVEKPATWISLVETVAELRKSAMTNETDPAALSKLAELIPVESRHLIQTRLLQFLHRHQVHLPGYGINVSTEASKSIKKWK